MASSYLRNAINDHVYGKTTFTSANTLYIALYTTLPTMPAGTGGTEVSGNNYSRLAVTNNTTNFPSSSGGSKTNGVTFTFATPSGSWGTVVGFGILDGSSGGNLYDAVLFTGSTTYAISSSNTVSFNTSTMTLTVT
jgi:hypothetical protein